MRFAARAGIGLISWAGAVRRAVVAFSAAATAFSLVREAAGYVMARRASTVAPGDRGLQWDANRDASAAGELTKPKLDLKGD
jgi:hypothetical protein